LTVEEFAVDNDIPLITDEPSPPAPPPPPVTTPPTPPTPPTPQLNPIKDPIWKSANTAADNLPLMMTPDDTLAYRVTFKLTTPLAEDLPNVGFVMTVLGGGMTGKITGTMTIPAGQTTFEAKLDKGKLKGKWKSQIIPDMKFTFEALPPTDCPFPIAAGAVEVKTYSARKRVTFPVYLSVLNIATDGTAVVFSNKGALIKKVWDKFGGGGGASTSGTLASWDGTPTFKYYPTGTMFTGNATNVEEMLTHADGASRCGAFAPLMGQALALNGLDAYLVLVRTKRATSPGAAYTDGMLVKNWTFSTTPSYPGLPTTTHPDADKFKWEFKVSPTAPFLWEMAASPNVNPGPYGDITSEVGEAGQNSTTPSQKAHVNHAIIKVENRWLDSSYGLEYSSEANFEAKALDGYFTIDVPAAAAPAKALAREKPYGVKFWVASVPF
jgi:hypothetical protein